jgi:hypothetical protein
MIMINFCAIHKKMQINWFNLHFIRNKIYVFDLIIFLEMLD